MSLAPILLFSFVAVLVNSPLAFAQPPLTSSPASGTLGVDPEAKLVLAWTTVPGAIEYVVELSESPAFDRLLPLKGAKVSAQPESLGQNLVVEFTDDTSLRRGRNYYWRVIAVALGSQARSEVATFRTMSDPFRTLADRRLYLTRAEDGVDKDKPATVAFVRQGGDSPSQQLTGGVPSWLGRSVAIFSPGRQLCHIA